MSVLKWLQTITRGLFVTCKRPIFLIFDENLHDETAVICNILSFLGGDVVSLRQKDAILPKDYLFYDGIFTLLRKSNKVTVVCKGLNGQKNKIYKKSFPLATFAI